jgi:hypothetical protein
MSTVTKRTSKRQDKTWTANISRIFNGVAALNLTSTLPSGKVESFGYYVTAIPSDFGVAYRLDKFQDQIEEDEPASYEVCIDPTDPVHGEHHCPCKGQQRWGHRHPCKHIRSLLKLHAAGLLPKAPSPVPEWTPDVIDEARYESL